MGILSPAAFTKRRDIASSASYLRPVEPRSAWTDALERFRKAKCTLGGPCRIAIVRTKGVSTGFACAPSAAIESKAQSCARIRANVLTVNSFRGGRPESRRMQIHVTPEL